MSLKVSINGVSQDWPITSNFMELRGFKPHMGMDFGIPAGTPVPSVDIGTVTQVSQDHALGNFVKVHLNNGVDVVYGHLSAVNVRVGELVSKGQQIALSGNTGTDTTGPHLHLGAWKNGFPTDPTPYAQNVGMIPGFGDKIIDAILNRIGDAFLSLGHMLNNNSAEIVTFCIVICGGMAMIAPLLGKSSGKWLSRGVGTLWIGAIWRILI